MKPNSQIGVGVSVATAFQWRSALVRLALKELKVRYKSPALGLLWAFVVPLLTSFVLAFVFGRLIPVPAPGVPYVLFLIVAMFPWNCIQATLMAATTSIQDNGSLIRKSCFPRQLIPCSIVLANLFNFLLTLVVVCGVVWARGVPLSWHLWLLPCAVILQAGLSIGLALFVSVLQVDYRDTKYLVEVTLLLLFYITPIVYPASTIVAFGRWGYYAVLANPLAMIVSLYRIALLGWDATGLPPGANLTTLLTWAIGATGLCVLAGWWMFQRRAPIMADLVQG